MVSIQKIGCVILNLIIKKGLGEPDVIIRQCVSIKIVFFKWPFQATKRKSFLIVFGISENFYKFLQIFDKFLQSRHTSSSCITSRLPEIMKDTSSTDSPLKKINENLKNQNFVDEKKYRRIPLDGFCHFQNIYLVKYSKKRLEDIESILLT